MKKPEFPNKYTSFKFVDSIKAENKGIASAMCRPLLEILWQKKLVLVLFKEITNKLTGFFSISKATLMISNPDKDVLRIITIWEKFKLRQGLWLILPRKGSLLNRIKSEEKYFYKPISCNFPGNFIKNRILMDKETCSLVVCPLVSNKSVCGFISLATPVQFAFEMVEKGYLDPVFNRFGKILAKEKYENVTGT